MGALVWQKPIDLDAAFDRHFLGVTLPSGESATDFIKGEEGSTVRLLLHWLGRSAILGVGLMLVGVRGDKIWKYALAGGTAIEASVLFWSARHPGEPLPTGDNASDLIEKKPGSFIKLVGMFIARMVEIGLGIFLAGERDMKALAKYSFGGSLAVEAFVQIFALLFHEPEKK